MNFVHSRCGKPTVADLIAVVAALMIAYALKSHYSSTGSEGLDWILRPTAWLVEIFDHSEFQHQQGTGYVRTDRKFIIAPACAGVNFMITAFCMIGMYGIRYNAGLTAKLRYLLFSFLGAYLLTLCTNSLRIHVSIVLFSKQVQWGWLEPARVHRLAGICIYLSSLLVMYQLLQKKFSGRNLWSREVKNKIFPYFWYIMIAVGVPLFNRGWQKGGWQFVEHCLNIVVVSLVVFLSCFLVKTAMCKIRI